MTADLLGTEDVGAEGHEGDRTHRTRPEIGERASGAIDDGTGDLEEGRSGTMLLARMAEAVYWAGRHLERAEGTARIVQVHTDAHVDLPVGEDVGWEPLLAIAGVDSEFAERYQAAAGPEDARAA